MDELLTKANRQMTAIERSEAQMNVAMASPDHLRTWLRETGRQYLVINTDDLVDALPWPAGLEQFQNIIRAYRDHRATVPTGETKQLHCSGKTNCQACGLAGLEPALSRIHVVAVCKDETLGLDEVDRAIRSLVSQIRELDPNWSLSDPPR